MKLNKSTLLAVLVMVGDVLSLHLTPVNVAVNPPEPVFKNSEKLLPAVAVGIVKVQLPVSVHV